MTLHLKEKFCRLLEEIDVRVLYFATLLMIALFCSLLTFFLVSPLLSSIFLLFTCAILLFSFHEFQQMAQNRKRLYKELERTVEVLSQVLHSKDGFTMRHTERVRQYSEVIARYAGLPEEEIMRIGWAAQLHDIGKLFIKEEILQKKTILSPPEFEHVKTHVKIDWILEPLFKQKIPVAEILHIGRLHHERFDGTGYPFGLKGEGIPIGARIIGVADAWDAMTSLRGYRERFSDEAALNLLEDGRGTQWDPKVLDAFMKAYKDKGFEAISSRYRLWLMKTKKETLERFERLLSGGTRLGAAAKGVILSENARTPKA